MEAVEKARDDFVFSERDNSKGIVSTSHRALATHQLRGQSQIRKTKAEVERKTSLGDGDRRGCMSATDQSAHKLGGGSDDGGGGGSGDIPTTECAIIV